VAQQALCNALGASDLHWVWAIDATSGPRFRFVRRQVNGKSRERSLISSTKVPTALDTSDVVRELRDPTSWPT
jgi:hypothetical protein